MTLPGSGGTVSFKYDPFGRRIYKSSFAATSIYAYDFDDLIEETNASGTVVARYSQGQNLDEPLAMLRSGATSDYQADGLGSVTSLSSGAGALAETYAFDSFGKQTSSSGSLTNPFQYTGREFDSETNLYFYRARYYDPSTDRFSKEDPVRYFGGINFYRFVRNNPVIFTDPFGLTDYNEWQTQQWLNQAYSDATAGYFRGLLNIGNHSQGSGDFDFAHNSHAGDTFTVCGIKMSPGDFGNYIAGFQGGVWDRKYRWYPYWPGLHAQALVEAAGIYYHMVGDTDVSNDPWNKMGMPWIRRGEDVGWNVYKSQGKCGCN